MLAVLGGIILVIAGIILAVNAFNEAEGKRQAEQRPVFDQYDQYGADGGPQGGGIRLPHEYTPDLYSGAAIICFIIAIVLFIIA